MHKYLYFSLLCLLKNKNNLTRLRAKHCLKKITCTRRPGAEEKELRHHHERSVCSLLTNISKQFKKLQLALHYRLHLPHHLPAAFFNIGDTSHSKLLLKIDHWSSPFNPANSLPSFPPPRTPTGLSFPSCPVISQG